MNLTPNDLTIHEGKEVNWHGRSAKVTCIGLWVITLSVCGIVICTNADDLAEQNPKLINIQ